MRNADGGSWGSKSFTYIPDALSFDYQRDNSKGTENAYVVAYLWKGTFTQKDVPANTAVGVFSWGSATKVDMTDRDRHVLGKETTLGGEKSQTSDAALIASLEKAISEKTSDWTNCIIPFNYQVSDPSTAGIEKINIIFSANDYFGDRSSIVSGNSLTLDNVKLIYYHALSDLKYDGSTVSGFSETKTSYDLSSTEYDEEKLEIVKKGVGATVETSYDEISGLLTITVKGNDYSVNSESVTTYTVQFKPIVYASYDEYSMINTSQESNEPYSTTATIYQTKDGSKRSLVFERLRLINASFGLTVNVTFRDFTIGEDNTFSVTKEGVKINSKTYTVTVEGKINNGVMRANVSSTNKSEGTYHSVFSDMREVTIDGTNTVEQVEQPGIYKVTIARTFKKGWNTWYMPCRVDEVSQLGSEVKAQEYLWYDSDGLQFVESESLSSGVPYLVWFPEETKSGVVYYATYLFLDQSEEYLADDIFPFLGNYEAGFDMEGKYGVADYKGDGIQRLVKGLAGSTLPATCAYFTSNASNAEGMVLHLEGETTAIGAATLQPVGEEGPVFSLQGVKVSDGATQGLPAGIYVKAGKKVIIK